MKLIRSIEDFLDSDYRVTGNAQKPIDLSKIEVDAQAAKLKSRAFSHSQLNRIQEDAENEYRVLLMKTDEDLLEIYLGLKTGKYAVDETVKLWKRIKEAADDTEFKRKYIEQRLAPNPETECYHNEARRQIFENRFKNKLQQIRKWGLNETDALKTIMIERTLRDNSSDSFNIANLLPNITSALLGQSPFHVVYYFCTRQTHNNGVPSITPHLEPIEKKCLDGSVETRTGVRYKKQLNEIRQLYDYLEGNGIFSQSVIIADFDCYRFATENQERLLDEAAEFTKNVQSQIGGVIVQRQTSFHDQINFDRELYKSVYESIIKNDGRFIDQDEVRRLRKRFARNSILIRNWDDGDTDRFTATVLAGSIVEGEALGKRNENYLLITFGNSSIQGRYYNLMAEKRISLISIDDGLEKDYSSR